MKKHPISDAIINVACRHAGLPFSARTKGLRMYARMGTETLAMKIALRDMPSEIPTCDVIPLALYITNLHYNGSAHGSLTLWSDSEFFRTLNTDKIQHVYNGMRPETLKRWRDAAELGDALRCTDYALPVEEDMPKSYSIELRLDKEQSND